MDKDNPLLNAHALPAFSTILPEHILPAVENVLDEYRGGIADLLADTRPRSFATMMLPQEALKERLEKIWSPVSHLHGVCDSEELRKAYSVALEKITEHASKLGQNRDLYLAVKTVADSAEFTSLERAARTLVNDALCNFRLSGVALEEPERSRFKEIANELAKLGSEFEEALLDATEAWSEHITAIENLKGLPDSVCDVLKQYGAEKGLNGWLVTLRQPSVHGVLTYADDRRLRERVYTAYNTRASDQGPHAGQFDNSQRIEKILALRHEAAQLLGFANSAEESLATKMAPDTPTVLQFLYDLVKRAKPGAEKDLAELKDFAAAEYKINDLQPWDIAYFSEKLRLQKFALNEEEIKPYFALPATLEGMFAIAQRLFGINFRERQDVDVWHPEVRYFDVFDENDQIIAGVYFDFYARAAKRGGAWMDVCRSRFRHKSNLQLPVAYLVCNFAPPTLDRPTLLTHDEVLTLFHEFGHGLHHLLTEIDYPSVAGIAGVEWDAVELPSQFMENFGWERDALNLFARHYQTGKLLPDELFQRMLAARHFQARMFLVRQLEFALFDFRLHLEYDPARGARVDDLLTEIRNQVAVIHPPVWQRFAHGFSHIFAGGYGAGYYSYLWAELLACDAFERFEQTNTFDVATGTAFRHSILAVGGSRPALESFIEFHGREPKAEALLKSYGLAI